MIYAVCKCANEIEEFRYRFLDGKVVLFDKIDTVFTWLNQDTELFKVVNVSMQNTLQEYAAIAIKTINKQMEILAGLWEMMFFNVLPCLGSLIPIFLTRIPGKRIVQHLCLIGKIPSKKREDCYANFCPGTSFFC